MVLDKQSQALLKEMQELNLPPVNTVSPKESRQQFELRPRLPGPQLPKVKYISVPIDGININCRLYIPDTNQNLPVLVWFHGGGWVLGNVDGSDGVTRHLATGSGCAVLSVNYRLSPEVKFPGPLNDCYGVTRWVYENAEDLNIDKDRISVGGDSAGGNLAAAVCLRAKDEETIPLVSQRRCYT